MVADAPSLSFDPTQTKVVLIGVTECQDPKIPPLPSVKNNLDQLQRLLVDPNIIGISDTNITKLLNPGLAELGGKVAQVAKEARDCFVVYYAGHGLKARRAEGLFLATRESTEDNCNFDSMNVQTLKDALESSNAQKRVLILDCCFSGEAIKGMSSESSLLAANLDIAGTFTLASSPATKISIAPEGATYTAFTGELIGLLQEGTGSENEYLSLQEIYEHVKRRISLKGEGFPEPTCRSSLDGNRIRFARNHRGAGPLELRVTRMVEAVTTRLSALEEILKGPNLHLSSASATFTQTSRFSRTLISFATFMALLVVSALTFWAVIELDLMRRRDGINSALLFFIPAVIDLVAIITSLSVYFEKGPMAERVHYLIFPKTMPIKAVFLAGVLGLIATFLIFAFYYAARAPMPGAP